MREEDDHYFSNKHIYAVKCQEGRLCFKYDVLYHVVIIVFTIMCLMTLHTICAYCSGH